MSNVSRLLDRYYYSRSDFTDGTTEFHALCSNCIRQNCEILEIGAGPTNRTSFHLATLGRVTGVDVSDSVLQNTALRKAFVYDGQRLPFEEQSFDACVSNYVLEHVHQPAAHFREVARVLKPGGVYCFRTPNLWHYITFMSYLLPYSVHRNSVHRLQGSSEEAHEPWPTVYAANSRTTLKRYCAVGGLEIVQLRMVEKEPSYGHLSLLLFYPMMGYERLVNSSSMFDWCRINIFGVLRKP
jgi:SAM-dependent methyltransferase